MNSATEPALVTLACHPRTPSQAIRGIEVSLGGAGGGGIALTFRLRGDLSAVRIPALRSPRRAEKLWRHTCFEAFMMAGAGPGYREYNFSPSGEWAACVFRGYRQGAEPAIEARPEITVSRTGDRLALETAICPALLPPARSLRVGLSAVVEAVDGGLSYWALRHPPGRPDFHHRDTFTLQLVLPGGRALNNLTRGVRA